MTLERAVQVFGKAFAYGRSFTYPYEFTRIGDVYVARDCPRREKRGRSEEFMAVGLEPDRALETIRANIRDRFFVCAIDEAGAPFDVIRDGYKAHGFRLMSREAIMVRPLQVEPIVCIDGPFPLARARTEEEATLVSKAAGHREILMDHLREDNAPVRLYYAHNEQGAVGWVRSISLGIDSFVSNMFVLPEYRRRGIARSLLLTMLADDQRLGIQHSVLTASQAGAKLYPLVGYQHIGTLQQFGPVAGRWNSKGT